MIRMSGTDDQTSQSEKEGRKTQSKFIYIFSSSSTFKIVHALSRRNTKHGTSEGRKTAYRHVREKLTNIDHHSPSVIGQTRNEIKSNHPWCGSGLACGSPGCTCYLILSDHLKAWLASIGCQEWSFEWTESRWVAREPVFVISVSFLVGIANSQTRRFLSAISTLT